MHNSRFSPISSAQNIAKSLAHVYLERRKFLEQLFHEKPSIEKEFSDAVFKRREAVK